MAKTDTPPGFHVLIAAAGSGQRFGNTTPKQYVKINGKSLLRHTLENVLAWPNLLSVQVIINPDHAALYYQAIGGLNLPPPLPGGKTRNLSIFNALKNISHVKNDEVIFIHDAARPFVKNTDVTALVEAMKTHKAATLAHPVTDTLRRDNQTINREGLWAVQTPQAFLFGNLKAAHEQTKSTPTDDTALMTAMGIPVHLVEGSRSNIKITTQDDLAMAEAILANKMEIRTGMGFDVHAFETSPSSRKLMLCGIHVPHTYALAGHSDADVGLHALTDALLGTVGAGDIGTHFPPSDNAYKNMDSAIFLKKSVDLIEERSGKINNVDITLICEAPKIGSHREDMVARISEITGLDKSRISIKATTTEKLGFTGRGEGIAAQAIATVSLPCC
jgi:2-C-methyl-D-erythritol 4-phosphate cytidylyltransferase/2-C-methyl-D-erythritol 2,4-cyclodiphosphate synthase